MIQLQGWENDADYYTFHRIVGDIKMVRLGGQQLEERERKKRQKRAEEQKRRVAEQTPEPEQVRTASFQREQEQRKFEQEKDIRRLQAGGFIKTPEQKAGVTFLEDVEHEKEKLPERVELDIERKGIEKLPVVGPAGTVVRNLVAPTTTTASDLINTQYAQRVKSRMEAEGKDVSSFFFKNEGTVRELLLREIQIKEIEKGTSGSEKFGALIESAQLAKFDKWLGGSIETPAENVNTVLKEIKDSRGRILKKYEAVRAGLLDPLIAYQSMLDEEEMLYKLEARIILLSLESAELIADADALNVVESKILRSKEVAFFSKEAAAQSLAGEPTDAKIEAWLASEIRALEEEE